MTFFHFDEAVYASDTVNSSCNCLFLYIEFKQVRVLLDKAKAVSKLWNDAPIVICGDFNCTPKVIFSVMVYHFLF